jgi:hypothetical protein
VAMAVSASTYLFALATISITFVGSSALVIILRQTIGGEMSRLDVLVTRIFIQLGFIVAAGALLPPLLMLYSLPPDLTWRVSSLAAAVPSFLFAVTYPHRRHAASAVPTPVLIWIDVLILLVAAMVLAWNASGVGIEPSAGPFAAALTAILFLSGWAYLQALNILLKPHVDRLTTEPVIPPLARGKTVAAGGASPKTIDDRSRKEASR